MLQLLLILLQLQQVIIIIYIINCFIIVLFSFKGTSYKPPATVVIDLTLESDDDDISVRYASIN